MEEDKRLKFKDQSINSPPEFIHSPRLNISCGLESEITKKDIIEVKHEREIKEHDIISNLFSASNLFRNIQIKKLIKGKKTDR